MNHTTVYIRAQHALCKFPPARNMLAFALAALCIVIAIILLIHHKIKHSQPGPDFIHDEGEQWFQTKDVCNGNCAHEKWVVALYLAAAILVLVGAMQID
eukprot:766114-Hanusia_phi.AAC.10